MKQFWPHFRKLDRKLDELVPLLLIVLVVFLLRLPSFAEPYWYGDEAIYLTIGNAMRHGERLYAEIIDHKTPIIYYLAMVPNQTWFRFLGLAANVSIVLSIWHITKRFFTHQTIRWLTVISCALALNLPALEGNIPNGETFVLFFISLALVFFWESNIGRELSQQELHKNTGARKQLQFAALSGIFASLAILTKVPAIFDVAAIGFGYWLLIIRRETSHHKSLKSIFVPMSIFVIGVVAPILLSIVYFWLRGSINEYLQFGLLYNFRYAGSWQLPFTQPLLVQLFGLPAKAAALAIGLLILSLFVAFKRINALTGWSSGWVLLALVGATLSNRPYPHYFLLLVVPVVLSFGLAIDTYWHVRHKAKDKLHEVFQYRSLSILTAVMCLFCVIATFQLLKVPFYPTVSYYQRFWQLVTGQKSWPEYLATFDQSVEENYKAARIIRTDKQPYLFVWGTNPLIYAATKKVPTGRFTVLFHIRDFKAEEETIRDFAEKLPTYALVMRGEEVPTDLYIILSQQYMISSEFQHFTLWRRINARSSL